MGYCMNLRDCDFFILPEKEQEALEIIKNLCSPLVVSNRAWGYSWVSNEEVLEAETLRQALLAWRWNYEKENRALWFEGEKLGEELTLFDAIAPCVEKGCYIEVGGEDGAVWRWFFDGENCIEQDGRVVFD